MVSLEIKILSWMLESSYILTGMIFKAIYERNFTFRTFSQPSVDVDYVI